MSLVNIVAQFLILSFSSVGIVSSYSPPTEAKGDDYQVNALSEPRSTEGELVNDDSNEGVLINAKTKEVKRLTNDNLFNLGKTGPYYPGSPYYVSGSTTKPVGMKTKVTFYDMMNSYGRKAKVQKYSSKTKKWVTVATKTTPKMKKNSPIFATFALTVPAWSKKSNGGKVSYRVYMPKTKSYKSYTSPKFKIKYVNPRFYKGYKKTLYNDMKGKGMCPNIIISVGKLKKGIAGTATFGKQYKIKIVSGLKGKYRKRVSVHECAHVRSDAVYGGSWSKMYKDSNRLFKIKNKKSSLGAEYLADCMSFAKMGKSYIPGYKKSCSSYQIKKAKRIWAGKKLY